MHNLFHPCIMSSPKNISLQIPSSVITSPAPPTQSQQQLPTKTFHNESTAIYKNLCGFEDELQRLTQSIQKYTPDPEIAGEIVVTADKINSELAKIQVLHDLRSSQTVKQNSENDSLDEHLRSVLDGLTECHKQLERLPDLPASEVAKFSKMDLDKVEYSEPDSETIQQLLSYAMRLSKFSRIPQTFDGFLLPNNFLWPGDDNMRRGMLAMSSMMPDKVINAENGDEEDTTTIKVEKDKLEKDQGENVTEVNTGFEHRSEKPSQKNAKEVMAGLDLFDEDDDDI